LAEKSDCLTHVSPWLAAGGMITDGRGPVAELSSIQMGQLRIFGRSNTEHDGEVAAMSEDFSVKEILSLCIDWSDTKTPRSKINQFVRTVCNSRMSDDERRSEKRRPVVLNIIAVPLDEDRNPCGEPFLALSRNISRGGIALLHTETVKAPYLLLRIETLRHEVIQAVVQVIRARNFYQFTEISGRFIAKTGKKRSPRRSTSAKRQSAAT
jgi:hypothetical protein